MSKDAELNIIKEDLEAILKKCFGDKILQSHLSVHVIDCVQTVIDYHSYKAGVIPYLEEGI